MEFYWEIGLVHFLFLAGIIGFWAVIIVILRRLKNIDQTLKRIDSKLENLQDEDS